MFVSYPPPPIPLSPDDAGDDEQARRVLLAAADRLDEYAALHRRIARCMVGGSGWRADPERMRLLAARLRQLADGSARRAGRRTGSRAETPGTPVV